MNSTCVHPLTHTNLFDTLCVHNQSIRKQTFFTVRNVCPFEWQTTDQNESQTKLSSVPFGVRVSNKRSQPNRFWMHDRQLFYAQPQFHRKMGKVNNKRKISRGGGKFNSVVVNALQPMQNTGVISVMQSNATNLNNPVSTTALTSVAHPQTNSSSNLVSLNQSSSHNPQNQSIMSLTPQQGSLNLAPNQQPNAPNQLIPNLSNQLQTGVRQPNNGSASVRASINSLQTTSNHPLLDLQAMNSLANCNAPDLSNQSALAMLGAGQPFSNLSNVNNVNLNSNLSASLGSNMNGNLVNNMTNSMANDLNDTIQPQHNSKCARFDTGSAHELKWDLKPSNLIKIENDLNPSPNSGSSNNHSHNSSSSLQEQANCLLKTNCDLNVKLTGGYSHKSRNGKYELKILKQPEEQHRWVSIIWFHFVLFEIKSVYSHPQIDLVFINDLSMISQLAEVQLPNAWTPANNKRKRFEISHH